MKISVVIPTYNRSELVCQAVQSVLAQTFTAYEVIVVDDGSIDGTRKVLTDYGKQIHYYWQENQGESAARNRGIALAQGEYIALLDSDDLWEPEKLQAQVQVLDSQSEVLAIGCESWLIDEQGQRICGRPMGQINDPSELSYGALRENNNFYGGGSTALIRKESIGLEPFACGVQYGEDWQLWLRLASRGTIAVVPRPLVKLRQHRGTQSCTVTAEAVDRRLADHLAILSQHPCPPDYAPAPGLDPAVARVYLRAALDDFVLGRYDLAQGRLGLSASSDGGCTLHRIGLANAIDRAVALARPTYVATDVVHTYFNAALAGLYSFDARPAVNQRTAWAQLYMSLATMAREIPRGNAIIRSNLLQAVRTDPAVSRRRAFWGGWLASLRPFRRGIV